MSIFDKESIIVWLLTLSNYYTRNLHKPSKFTTKTEIVFTHIILISIHLTAVINRIGCVVGRYDYF